MARLYIPDHIVTGLGQGPLNDLSAHREKLKALGYGIPSLVTHTTTPPSTTRAPESPSTPPISASEAPTGKTRLKAPPARIAPKRPKPRPRPPARKPLNTPARFIAAHEEDPRRLARYLDMGHKNHVQLSLEAQQDLEPGSAIRLPANNYTARIDYARIATAHLIRFAQSLPRSEPVFWVTLIAKRFTVGLNRAGDFDPYRLQQWVRAVLQGCSFVGMVEAALYSNVGLVMDGMQKAVSWHVHLLVWGVTAPQLNKLKISINRRVKTMIPGVKAAHFRPLRLGQIEGQTLYMLKAPVNEYRVYPRKKTDIDPSTGEFTESKTGRFSTKKYQLGPGDLARMANIMSGKRLNRLAFAAEAGKPVLEAINDEALAGSRAAERRERSRELSRRSLTARVKRRAGNVGRR